MQTQPVKLATVWINDTDYNKKPYIDEDGNPFKRVAITSESGNKASMIIKNRTGVWDTKLAIIERWKPGDTVDLILTQKGDYLNFDIITPLQTEQPLERTTEPPTPQISENHVTLSDREVLNEYFDSIERLINKRFCDVEQLIQDTCGRKESNFSKDPDVLRKQLTNEKFKGTNVGTLSDEDIAKMV